MTRRQRIFDTDNPFILFDDFAASGDGRSRLYSRPVEIIETRDPDQVRACLDRLRHAQDLGLHAAGLISYEAGHCLEERLVPLRRPAPDDAPPLIWFGLFESCDWVNPAEILPDASGAWSGEPRPLIDQAEHQAMIERAMEHIRAGDIYQANLTFRAEVTMLGSPLALFASIRQRAAARHGGVLFTGEHWILSFSPELFFSIDQGEIVTRPMKGTARRQKVPELDRAAIECLRKDPKQLAENLMIVDLLRNDLSRVAKAGSVAVPSLFTVETYPTVHQMTSTIVAQLADGLSPVDVVEAIFPCGSITGAPKIRATEIIAQTEADIRNLYTGSIGWIEPGGDASFNVAIRTLVKKADDERATMGLGSGIVADSDPGDEWRECIAKGAFVKSTARFDLVETMRFDPADGIAELERHLMRMKASADRLERPFDRHSARNDLQAATFRLRDPRMIRLLLSAGGRVAIESRPLPMTPTTPVEVAIRPLPVSPEDFRLRHKTTSRAFYDEARDAAGKFEILFHDQQGYLTEGSFTNLFVERDGTLLTPPLRRGLLPGILREALIAQGRAKEADLRAADVRQGLFIGNAVRGLLRARLVEG